MSINSRNFQRGLRVGSLLILLVAIPSVASADCYWELLDVTQVTTWGYTTDPKGNEELIPMGTTTYYYWGLVCYGTIVVAPQPGTSPSPPLIQPSLSIAFIDTTDPYSPIVAIDVSTPDPNYPPDSVTLWVNGGQVSSSPWYGNARYQLRMPAVTGYPDGNTPIVAEACAVSAFCGSTAATMYRATPAWPLSASENMHANWLEGDTFMSADFGHQLQQTYQSTSFNISEIGQNSRQELGTSFVTISHMSYDPAPYWNGSASAYGTVGNGTYWASLGCSMLPPPYAVCPSICATACATEGLPGYLPYVVDQISSFRISLDIAGNVSGGSLAVYTP